MPRPEPGETQSHYMTRCVREVMGEGTDQKAAVGKCEGMWDEYKKSAPITMRAFNTTMTLKPDGSLEIMKSTFGAPASATSGLQPYDLEGAGSKKVSKAQADYVSDGGSKPCQSCTMFIRPDACTKVRGKISPDGHCKYYDALARKSAPPLKAAGIALVTGEGKALFIRRSNSGDHAGEWCFPGGGIEAGETAEAAAIRESMEEVGIALRDTEKRTEVVNIANDEVDFTTFHQPVEEEFEPHLNHEHDAFQWASLEKPPEPLHPGVRSALPLVISAATEITLKAAAATVHKRAGETSAATSEDSPMDTLALFVQLKKVDAKQRIVYGTAVVEQPDRVGEIFDYSSSKPEFEKWSNDIAKASDGKSLGNIRAMHGPIAVGKITDIGFDDERKAIDIAAKVVDDNEWKKVEEGVYTGFSIGGRYLKRWTDGELKRYTASPSEISLVDLPCVKEATFQMVKADGSEELRKFVTADAEPEPEPTHVTNALVAKRAGEIAAAEGGKWSDYMDTARFQLDRELAARKHNEAQKAVTVKLETGEIAAQVAKAADRIKVEASNVTDDFAQVWQSKRLPGQTFAKKSEMMAALTALDAEEAIAKAAAPLLDALKASPASQRGDRLVIDDPHYESLEKREFSEDERKKDAKSGAAEPDGSYPIENAKDLENAIHAYGRSKNKAKTKRHIISRARSLGLTAKLPAGWSKKAEEAADLRKAANLYMLSDLMHMLSCVECMEDRAESSNYGSGVDLSKDLTDRFGSVLVELGDITAEILDAVLDDIREEERGEAMERAAPLQGLLKRGARHSNADKAIIQKIHDHLVSLAGEDICHAPAERQEPDREPGDSTVDVGDSPAGHPGTAVNPKSDLDPYKMASAEELVKAAVAARDEAFTKVLAEITAGVNQKFALIEAEKAEMAKKLAQIEGKPAPLPPGTFRAVDKSIDSGGAPPAAPLADDADLRAKGNAAQFQRRYPEH